MTQSSIDQLLGGDTLEAFVARLVAAGQPWCENSLDGPVRPTEEVHAARSMAALLEGMGLDVSLRGVSPLRPNVVATKRFGPGRTLILNDHLDNYPSGPPSRWKKCSDPYDMVAEGDRLYARATSDTRGNMAALMLAVSDVLSAPPDTGTLIVALTVDEERNGVVGAKWLTRETGLTADASITVEPTAWRSNGSQGIAIATSHTGHALLDISFSGTASHIWRPDTGVNPAHLLIAALSGLRSKGFRWPFSVVGLTCGEAGMAQFTPVVASARVAVVNIGPGVSSNEVLTELMTVVKQGPLENVEVSAQLVSPETFVAGTVPVESRSPILVALDAAYQQVTGQKARHYAKPAYCDTIRFREAAMPALTFGPGDDGWAVYDESISLQNIRTASEVLAIAIRNFLGGEPK